MNGARDRKVPFGLFLVIIISFIALGCENPGSVGRDLDDSNIRVADTTIYLPSTTVESVDAYSGLRDAFSAGIFEDPLFGNVEAVSLLKPSLLPFDEILGVDAVMKLRLHYDSQEVYGDSTAQADFRIVEIDQLWRAKAWRYSDEPVLVSGSGGLTSEVASFSVANEDSIEVTLGGNWFSKYRSIYNNSDDAARDSLYLYDLLGLAVVPQNNAQIIPFSSSRSEFVIETAEDTLRVGLRDWATSLDRSNEPALPTGTNPAFSTLEKLSSFRMELTAEEFGSSINIANVELIMPVDMETLEQSLDPLSSTTARPDSTFSELYLLETQLFSESIGPTAPVTTGRFIEADSSFHYNITSLVNSTVIDGLNTGERFYVTLGANDGILRSSLFFNENAPAHKRPRIKVTYIKSEDL